jgi:hypothetical protein
VAFGHIHPAPSFALVRPRRRQAAAASSRAHKKIRFLQYPCTISWRLVKKPFLFTSK